MIVPLSCVSSPAEEGHELATLDRQRDGLERREATEGFSNAFEAEERSRQSGVGGGGGDGCH
jgi:hypothetical protein